MEVEVVGMSLSEAQTEELYESVFGGCYMSGGHVIKVTDLIKELRLKIPPEVQQRFDECVGEINARLSVVNECLISTVNDFSIILVSQIGRDTEQLGCQSTKQEMTD